MRTAAPTPCAALAAPLVLQARRALPRRCAAVVKAAAAAPAAPAANQSAVAGSVEVTFSLSRKVWRLGDWLQSGRRPVGCWGSVTCLLANSRKHCMHLLLPQFKSQSPRNVAHTSAPHPPVQVEFGQDVLIVGSHETLGAWQLDGAARCSWKEGDVWEASVDLPAGAELEYKFVVADPSQ